MNFDVEKNYKPPSTHPVRNQGVEHQQEEGIQFEYEDQEEDLQDNYVDGTEQQIEMMEFQDSKALENMVHDLENFNEKFANMSIK